MENASFATVRLESTPYKTKKGVAALYVVYFLGLVTCLIMGVKKGPTVFMRRDDNVESDSLNVTWYGQVGGIEPVHQVLFLQMRLLKPTVGTSEVSYEQRYTVSSWGAHGDIDPSLCPDGCTDTCDVEGQCLALTEGVVTDRIIDCSRDEEWCGWETLIMEDFVKYKAYYMKVDMVEPDFFADIHSFTLGFEIVYISEEFTHFQMTWFYAWVMITLCFMFLPKIGFFTEMLKLHQNFWSRQQVRVGAMLVALLFFNNVFFVLQIHSPFPRFFFSVYIVFLATFLAIMLFFWLELFGDLAVGNIEGSDTAQEWERNRQKTLLEYLPKLILVGLIWIVTILVYIYVRVKQVGDPSYSTFDDLSSYTGVKTVGIILATVYFLWLGFLIVGSFAHVREMNTEYQFILHITLTTIVLSIVAIYLGALAPDQHGAKMLAFFYGVFNTYVLLMAFCYTPAGSTYGGLDTRENLEMVPAQNSPEHPENPNSKDDTFTIVESDSQVAVL